MRNIVLVGFMGTGKTAAGKKLAGRLNREFLELDEIIEDRVGLSIREIFEKKGEPYFRRVEKDIVREASDREGIVISAGGGAVIDEENFKNLKKNSVIICLGASPDVILERTKNLATRPLLNVPDPKKKIESLLKERAPYYKKADFCINTDNLSIEEVAERIQGLIDL
ncbi:shikimate kinase [Candidatus Omnitrophota bacterium]